MFVDAEQPALLERAEALLGVFSLAQAEAWSRGRIESSVEELIGDRRDHKLVRGLVKVLTDASEFEVRAPVPPVELRREVFLAARRSGPLALEPGPLGRRVAADVLAEVARDRGMEADQVAAAMYADLREAHRIVAVAASSPRWLLHRYNVALVQALLLRALEVRLRLRAPESPRVRQLFRHVKFHQLMHHITREGDDLVVVLDGPTSLFRQSTRYGLQLATFFPALLLQECPWWLEATVVWTKARRQRTLRLSRDQGLRSHYRDTGAYSTREAQWFAERFVALDSPWVMSDRTAPIDLGGRALVLPDFSFTREGRTAHLEILGFWRRDYLQRRARWLERYGPGNLVLAVSRKLRGGAEELESFAGEVVSFAQVVPAREVEAALERVGCVER